MKKLTADQFREYMANPLAFDGTLRELCNLSEDKYYTVATWPEERAGEVRVTSDLHRVVRSPKISKSNQT
jgi:hypothetical protein